MQFNCTQYPKKLQPVLYSGTITNCYPYGNSTASELLSLEAHVRLLEGAGKPLPTPRGKRLDLLEQFARDPHELHRLAHDIIDLYPKNPKRAFSLVGNKKFLSLAGKDMIFFEYEDEAKRQFKGDNTTATRQAVLFTVIKLLTMKTPHELLAIAARVKDLSRKQSLIEIDNANFTALEWSKPENRKEAKNYFSIPYEDAQKLTPVQALVLGLLRDKDYVPKVEKGASALNISRQTYGAACKELRALKKIDYTGAPVDRAIDKTKAFKVPKSLFQYTAIKTKLTPATVLVYSFYWTRTGAKQELSITKSNKNDARNFINISNRTYKNSIDTLRALGLIHTEIITAVNARGLVYTVGVKLYAKTPPEYKAASTTKTLERENTELKRQVKELKTASRENYEHGREAGKRDARREAYERKQSRAKAATHNYKDALEEWINEDDEPVTKNCGEVTIIGTNALAGGAVQ